MKTREFMFGSFYDELSDKERVLINDSHDEFQISKNEFIREMYPNNEDTQYMAYNLYETHIRYAEKHREKDLCKFSSFQIADLIIAMPTTSKGSKERLFNFINLYCDYCVAKGIITFNPCDSVDREEVTKVNSKALKQKIIGLSDFWSMVEEMKKHTDTQMILPVVLARYGIMGGSDLYDMRSLKMEQIDKEDESVILYERDGSFKTRIPVDKRFIAFIDEAFLEDTVEDSERIRANEIKYENNGYIIKRSSVARTSDTMELEMAIYSRARKSFKCIDKKNLPFGMLFKSRKIELLLRIREHRKITTKDILDIQRLFEPTASEGSYNTLVRDYKALTGEDVLLIRRVRESDLIDNKSKEFVLDIREKLDLWELE